ncbi:MAG TPA: UDP-N-acetylglucosamine 2-epimerase (non-hydrolyzing) [Planctomycetes bacterium]|nr:UDP-N-acetylglucosamine 2-epimerase (non-hydrolyzing) [Planctomycetota bacterium]
MNKKRVIVTVGTRPEVIKMAPLVMELRKARDFQVTLVSTSQHREMLDQALAVFRLEPDFDLDIMRPNQSLADSTARALRGMGRVLQENHPDLLLVQGDTNTVLAGALAAHYHKIPVGHVEAGLRTDDPYLPFPEEMNRRLTSQLTRLHFAPTRRAADNLLREGIPEDRVFVTGNTVIDALYWTEREYPDALPRVAREVLERGNRYLLVTAHRRESLDGDLLEMAKALGEIVSSHPEIEIIYPVHLNPKVQSVMKEVLGGRERAHLIPPVSYPEIVQLMRNCYFILTDSGGIQEEAPAFGKPVLVMREVTERPEAVEAGVARLAGVTKEGILRAASELLEDPGEYRRRAHKANPFGDGKACQRIAGEVTRFLGR